MSRRRTRLKSVKGSQGAPPADLPVSAEVWEADVVPLPDAARAAVPGGVELRVAIAAVVGSELVVGTEIGDWTDDAEAIAVVVLEAMTAPMAGNPRRPAAVRVRRADAADALSDRLPKGTDVEFADTLPAVEAVARGLDEFLLGESLAGASPQELSAMENFFDAAAAFYEAAPWRRLGEATPLEISVANGTPVFGIVLGEQGEMHGLALHDSFDQLHQLTRGARDESDVRLVFYLPESDVPPTIAEQRRLRRWRVAGPAAFPVLVRRLADGTEPNPDIEDLHLVAAALRATRTLEAGAAAADLAEPGEVSFLVGDLEGEITSVRIAWPAGGGLRSADDLSAGDRGEPSSNTAASATAGEAPPDAVVDLEELVQRITQLPSARRVFPRLAWTFFRAPTPIHVDEAEMDDAMARFTEWAMFSAHPGLDRPTLAEQALRKAAKQLTPQRLATLAAAAEPRHSLYRITAVHDDGATVLDVLRGTTSRVKSPSSDDEYREGDEFIGNIFPAGEDTFQFGSTMTAVEGELAADVEPPDQAVAAVQAESDVFGASTEWIAEIEQIAELRQAWSEFRGALAGTGTRLPTFGALQKRIRSLDTVVEVLRPLGRRSWWFFEEAEICAALVQQAWNLTPRDELGGRSPLRAYEEERSD